MSAAGVGAVLGLGGSWAPERIRVTVVSAAAIVLIAVGVWHLFARSPRLWERNCETAQAWMERGAFGWAATNGAALGAGFTSRIGFVGWYAIPIACVAFGDPAVGALIFGSYGATRGFAVWAWFAVSKVKPEMGQTEIADVLFRRTNSAKRASASLLVLVAIATIGIVGV